jgi:50S ribosomal subunit-associated GTPase HflX
MWVSVLDRAAVVYDVEFMRAYAGGGSLAVAHRVAVAQVAMEWPAMAGAAFMLPSLANGYGKIEQSLRRLAKRMGAIEGRLTRIERGLGTEGTS